MYWYKSTQQQMSTNHYSFTFQLQKDQQCKEEEVTTANDASALPSRYSKC